MYSRVYVEITNICNMHCSFCHSHSREPRRMSAEEFSVILDKLSGHTKYIYYHLMGEPLSHPELPEFLDMAAERGFKSQITTNGTLLSSRGYELLSHPVHKINISLHSFEGADTAVHKKYLTEVADFADAASRAGVIVVLRLWNRGFDGGKNDRVLTLLRERIDGEWAENTRGLRLREKLFVEWGERFEWPDKDAPVKGDEFFCYGLRDHFGILCDGSVVPCCLDSDGIITLGNIFERDLSDILSSPRAAAMVEAFGRRCASEELCRRCGYAQRFIKN
ncbi:MAG: radical SAM protein [Ruminococcaceae bacterium]|nr:radical SAM protein [Oscillospiraceae bacterium]